MRVVSPKLSGWVMRAKRGLNILPGAKREISTIREQVVLGALEGDADKDYQESSW